jgi:uncharacterized membrane protein YgdD (TMEM256/DUF423 family)
VSDAGVDLTGGEQDSAVDTRRIMAAGALLAALGVALGAFGAHGLERVLDERAMGWWQTAVSYQMWSALGLVGLGASRRTLGLPALLIGIGAIIFSGGLYAMALTGARWLGMVVPIGGAAMIVGWLFAAWRINARA